eukprot:6182401-Ditylum_brightwellii.AAC.1
MEVTPMNLVVDRDAVLNAKHEAKWKYILIEKNNKTENRKRESYHYKVNHNILNQSDRSSKFGSNAHSELYLIFPVNGIGTVNTAHSNPNNNIILVLKPHPDGCAFEELKLKLYL